MAFIILFILRKNNFSKNIISKLVLFFLIINNIDPKIIRPDNDPSFVSYEVINRIHSAFHTKDVIYKENLIDYTISMKFLNIRIYDEGIFPEKIVNREFFSIGYPEIEFILNINITNNNDFVNSPINKADIIFNNVYDNPTLNFQLKNMNANITANFIEFVRNEDGTYRYVFFYDDLDYPKIYKFLYENKKNIENFLFTSFSNYLGDILYDYPKSDTIYLYEKLVEHILSVQTFALNITSNTNLEKVIINNFKEKEYIMDSALYITNIEYNIDLIFDGESQMKNYRGIIPEMYFTTKFFTFGGDDHEIANTTINTIINEVFNMIIDYYIK